MDPIKKSTVCAIRNNHYHLPNYRARWTENDDNRLREEYLTGSDLTDIALELGRPETGVMQRAQKLGLRPRINKKRMT